MRREKNARRRIGTFDRVLVASPDYLASRPAVRTLDDLAACDFIAVTVVPDAITLLGRESETVTFHPENVRLEVDTIASAKSAVLAGLDVKALPHGEVEAELAAGRLARLLPDWRLPALGVYAVWPDSGPRKPPTRRLIDFFAEALTDHASAGI